MKRILPLALIGIWLFGSHVAFAQTTEAKAGSIEGRVIFEGTVPKDPTPDENGSRDNLITVDPGNRGLMNAVVYLEARSSAGKDVPPPAKMDQVNHRFVSRVLAVRAGQTVLFTNSDPANHNVRTTSLVATNEFNVFTGNEGSYQRVFGPDPKARPIKVGCDIHPWMRGWIYVFDHPYFGVTDKAGEFRIAGIAPGEYQIAIEQPDIRYQEKRSAVIRAGEKVRMEFRAKMESP